MKSADLNKIIEKLGRGVLYVPEPIDARDTPVIIPAGVEGRIILGGAVKGSIVIGGYSTGKPSKGDLVRPKVGHTETAADGVATRPMRHYVRIGGEPVSSDHEAIKYALPLAWGVHLTVLGDIDAEGKATGIHVDRAINSSVEATVYGAESIGVNFKHCRGSIFTGKVFDIGNRAAGATGQSYGVHLQGCRGCGVRRVEGDGVRYIVTLNEGGADNVIEDVTGWASVAPADVHGGGEIRPRFIRVAKVRPYNDYWRALPVDPQYIGVGVVEEPEWADASA